MRQRHSCSSHGSNVEHNVLRSWHATMYKFVTSMVLCGLGMQQCAMHNATIQKTTFFELGVYQPNRDIAIDNLLLVTFGWLVDLQWNMVYAGATIDCTKKNGGCKFHLNTSKPNTISRH